MKVALVLTGLSRCWEQAHESFKQNFLDRFECDVFIDIWSEKGYYSGVKGYLPEVNGYVQTVPGEKGFFDSGELVDANALMQAYKPKVLHIEDFSSFEPVVEKRKDYFKNAYTRPKNTLSQAYKVWNSMKILSEYMHHCGKMASEEYQLVVRARPDIVLEHMIPMEWMIPSNFLTLPSKNKIGKGTGDSIQISSNLNIFSFAQMYMKMESLYDTLGVSCPHMFVEQQIKNIIERRKEEREYFPLNWMEMVGVGAHVAHSPKGAYQEPV